MGSCTGGWIVYTKIHQVLKVSTLEKVHCIPWEKKNQVTRDHISVLDLATKYTKSSPSPKKKVVQATLAFGKPKPSTPTKSTAADNKKAGSSGDGGHSSSPVKGGSDENSKDNAFREFRRICARLAEEPSYNAKSKILADFFENGSSGGTACNTCVWISNLHNKLLLQFAINTIIKTI